MTTQPKSYEDQVLDSIEEPNTLAVAEEFATELTVSFDDMIKPVCGISVYDENEVK